MNNTETAEQTTKYILAMHDLYPNESGTDIGARLWATFNAEALTASASVILDTKDELIADLDLCYQMAGRVLNRKREEDMRKARMQEAIECGMNCVQGNCGRYQSLHITSCEFYRDQQAEPKQVADNFAMRLSGSTDRIDAIVDAFEGQHRTTQQDITRLCIAWLARVASDDYGFDGRNEQSHKVAKAIMGADLGTEIYLPRV